MAAAIPTGRIPASQSCQNSWPERSVSTGPPAPRSSAGRRTAVPIATNSTVAGRPVVGALVDPHADDRVGAGGLRLLEQAPEREPAASL